MRALFKGEIFKSAVIKTVYHVVSFSIPGISIKILAVCLSEALRYKGSSNLILVIIRVKIQESRKISTPKTNFT